MNYSSVLICFTKQHLSVLSTAQADISSCHVCDWTVNLIVLLNHLQYFALPVKHTSTINCSHQIIIIISCHWTPGPAGQTPSTQHSMRSRCQSCHRKLPRPHSIWSAHCYNKVKVHGGRVVWRWTLSRCRGFGSRPWLLCINANSACHPYGVGYWEPTSYWVKA